MMLSEKSRNIMAGIAFPLRVYLGIVFIAASLYKIWEPYDFALSVATYQLLPYWIVNLFAILLPMVEAIIGACLVLGLWTRASALAICGMMLMFLTSLIMALSKDLKMSCGCFASQATVDEIGMHTVFRDLAWLGIGAVVLVIDDGRFGLDGLIRKRRQQHD